MSKENTPFFSIISVTYNDAWSLMKTARSVFEQNFQDFEFIIVDGASQDGSTALMEFWHAQGLAGTIVSEPDTGVYDAMNKGMRLASGRYVCFLNASDVFADAEVLRRVHGALGSDDLDGLLGWGELNNQIWASWAESDAIKMASLGFCHQSLYVRRSLLLQHPFDDRPFKTDSDTLQLGRLYAAGARIPIVPEILAKRGGEPGISANIERTRVSIRATILQEYPALSEQEAEDIIGFRRSCAEPGKIEALMAHADGRIRRHVAIMVLDTLFQRPAAKLPQDQTEALMRQAIAVLEPADRVDLVDRLALCQTERARLLGVAGQARRSLDKVVTTFESEEERRIAKLRAAGPLQGATPPAAVAVSLTSFPARLKTVAFAIRSLFEQTVPPGEIHLWLGRDEIPGPNWLPRRLRALEERGLQIHFCARTRHQYDKFLHNADLNAQLPVIIADDDVIYPPTAIEALVTGAQQHPGAVIGNRCHWIATAADGSIAPYRDWPREVNRPAPSARLIATGAGGVLYPKDFLTDPAVTDIDLILSRAPYADDIWLKAIGLARGIPTFATPLSHKGDWYHRYTPTMR
ncbi:MAG: glycosyltransferase, partial [Pararhodobacter sp.]|nr:glycosyltransferase [Pararhodobacter sp.]